MGGYAACGGEYVAGAWFSDIYSLYYSVVEGLVVGVEHFVYGIEVSLEEEAVAEFSFCLVEVDCTEGRRVEGVYAVDGGFCHEVEPISDRTAGVDVGFDAEAFYCLIGLLFVRRDEFGVHLSAYETGSGEG